MYCDNSGGTLSITATPGSFSVNGTKFAKVTLSGDTSKVYRGIPSGSFSVPAGSYDITYFEELSASEYDANVDTEVDVKDLVAAKKASYSYDSSYRSWAFYNGLFLKKLTGYILYN